MPPVMAVADRWLQARLDALTFLQLPAAILLLRKEHQKMRKAFLLAVRRTLAFSLACVLVISPASANTVFTSYTFAATGSPALRTLPARLAETKNVMDMGALCDGTGALLSTRYGSLAAAQAVYPFVISTGVTIDWAAITAAVKWNSLYSNATGATAIGGSVINVAAVPAAVQASPTSYTIKDLNKGTPLVSNLNASIATATATSITLSQTLLIAVANTDIIEFVPADVGTVYIPFGHCVVNSLIDFDGVGSIIFRGDGRGSQVSGNFAGFIFDRPGLIASGPGIRVFEKLNIVNSSTSAGAGGIRLLGNDGGALRDMTIQAHVGIDIGGVQPSDTSFDTHIISSTFNGLGGWEAGSIGVMLGPETSLYESAIVGFENGVRAYGAGINVIGGRIERNKVGIFLGKDAAGSSGSVTGCHIFAISLEANDIGIHASVANSCLIGGFSIQGSSNSPAGGSTYGIKWDNGTNNTFQSIIMSADASSFTSNAFFVNPGSTFKGIFDAVTAATGAVGTNWSFTPSPEYSFRQSNNTTNALTFATLPSSPLVGDTYYITDGNQATAGGNVTAGGGANKSWVTYNGTNWIRGAA